MSAVPGTTAYPLPQTPAAEPSDSRISTPLKILIVAVAAIAAGALGFLIAGLVALSVGALAGGVLAALCVSFCPSTNHEAIAVHQPVEEELDLREICMGPLADPSLLWITSTRAPYLAQILALHRLEKLQSNGRPVFVQTEAQLQYPSDVMPNLILEAVTQQFPLGFLTACRKDNPIFAIDDPIARGRVFNNQPPFDVEKELQRAYMLPGNPQISDRLHPDHYFLELQPIIGKVLQYGITENEKNDLKHHLQHTLLPMLNSSETINECIQGLGSHQFEEHQFNSWRAMVHKLIEICDTVQPVQFNPTETALIQHPCILVFGSKTVATHPQWPNSSESRLIIEQNTLELGTDLQCVYTTPADIPRVQAAVAPWGVEVRDIRTLTQQ